MAERLDNFNWDDENGRPGYPWDDWSDGSTWRILQVALQSMASQIYLRANSTPDRGARVSFLDDPPGIRFQFYPLNEPDRRKRARLLEQREARKQERRNGGVDP